MSARPNAEDYVSMEFLNDKELEKLFDELIPAVQNRIVLNGMKTASKVILDQAKQNFRSIQLNKSKTGYKNFNKSFTTSPMRSKFGLIVGVKNYKYRFIDKGTAERSYKKGTKASVWRKKMDKSGGHNTGRIKKTDFFVNAVNSRKDEAQEKVSQSIIDSLNKTIARYNKR